MLSNVFKNVFPKCFQKGFISKKNSKVLLKYVKNVFFFLRTFSKKKMHPSKNTWFQKEIVLIKHFYHVKKMFFFSSKSHSKIFSKKRVHYQNIKVNIVTFILKLFLRIVVVCGLLGYFFLHLILFKYHLFIFKYTHQILFKAQEYLYSAIFEKPMIQVHGKTILSMEFKSIIKVYDLNSWQFIYPKAQFSLAKSKLNSHLQYQKPNSHWQYQNPILIGKIKAQFLLATSKSISHWQNQSSILIGNIKTQFLLAISKPNFHWRYFVKKEPKIINTWQRKLPWQSSYKKTHWELS